MVSRATALCVRPAVQHCSSHHPGLTKQRRCCWHRFFMPTGTNFEGTFPEIHWSFGYWYFLSLCAGVTITFLLLLRQMGMWGHG